MKTPRREKTPSKNKLSLSEDNLIMIISAEVTTVQVGFYTLEGLMDEDGTFYIGIPQLADLVQTNRNTASRDFKRLMGEGFKTSKLKTIYNTRYINAISLKDFELLIAKLDRKGNVDAQEIRDQLVGLSLHQVFCDAFGVKFEKEERQEWLKLRQATKLDFKDLTSELKRHGFNEPHEYACFVKRFQDLVGIDSGTRDYQIREKLAELIKTQSLLIAYMECDIKPFDAIEKLKSHYSANK